MWANIPREVPVRVLACAHFKGKTVCERSMSLITVHSHSRNHFWICGQGHWDFPASPTILSQWPLTTATLESTFPLIPCYFQVPQISNIIFYHSLSPLSFPCFLFSSSLFFCFFFKCPKLAAARDELNFWSSYSIFKVLELQVCAPHPIYAGLRIQFRV